MPWHEGKKKIWKCYKSISKNNKYKKYTDNVTYKGSYGNVRVLYCTVQIYLYVCIWYISMKKCSTTQSLQMQEDTKAWMESPLPSSPRKHSYVPYCCVFPNCKQYNQNIWSAPLSVLGQETWFCLNNVIAFIDQ